MEESTKSHSEDELDALEAHLAGTLTPVAPSNDFVQRLRDRIRLPAPQAIALRIQDWRRLFLIFGGVMSALLVLITVARALFHLFGRKEM